MLGILNPATEITIALGVLSAIILLIVSMAWASSFSPSSAWCRV